MVEEEQPATPVEEPAVAIATERSKHAVYEVPAEPEVPAVGDKVAAQAAGAKAKAEEALEVRHLPLKAPLCAATACYVCPACRESCHAAGCIACACCSVAAVATRALACLCGKFPTTALAYFLTKLNTAFIPS
jgi:hypothetical protein